MSAQILDHNAIVPVAHLRRLLKAHLALETAAGVGRIMAIVWVVAIMFRHVECAIGAYCMPWFRDTVISPMPLWCQVCGWLAIGLGIFPARIFRRAETNHEPAEQDAVEVAHSDVTDAERALTIYYLFGALLVVSQVVAVMASFTFYKYSWVAVANLACLLCYYMPMWLREPAR
jgi:hypothetical protein